MKFYILESIHFNYAHVLFANNCLNFKYGTYTTRNLKYENIYTAMFEKKNNMWLLSFVNDTQFNSFCYQSLNNHRLYHQHTKSASLATLEVSWQQIFILLFRDVLNVPISDFTEQKLYL